MHPDDHEGVHMSVSPDKLYKYAYIGAQSERARLITELGEANDFLEGLDLREEAKSPIVPGQEPVADQPVVEQSPAAKAKNGKKSAETRAPEADSTTARAEAIKRTWSPAARKAVSERMKRYWAMRRAAKQQPATVGVKDEKTTRRKPVWTRAMRAAASRRGKAQAARRKQMKKS